MNKYTRKRALSRRVEPATFRVSVEVFKLADVTWKTVDGELLIDPSEEDLDFYEVNLAPLGLDFDIQSLLADIYDLTDFPGAQTAVGPDGESLAEKFSEIWALGDSILKGAYCFLRRYPRSANLLTYDLKDSRSQSVLILEYGAHPLATLYKKQGCRIFLRCENFHTYTPYRISIGLVISLLSALLDLMVNPLEPGIRRRIPETFWDMGCRELQDIREDFEGNINVFENFFRKEES